MGWCDDPNSKSYNKLIRLPFKYNFEKLYKTNNTLGVIFIVLNTPIVEVIYERGAFKKEAVNLVSGLLIVMVAI